MEEELSEFVLSNEGEVVDYKVLEPFLKSGTERGQFASRFHQRMIGTFFLRRVVGNEILSH